MPAPEKYNAKIAPERSNWVKGSVEGVKIAPIIVDPKMTYRHAPIICFAETMFKSPKIT